MAELRLVSWNVNGLRAVMKKDPSFEAIFRMFDADVFALQETKLSEGQVALDLPGYHQTWSYAEKKGYSGTAVFSKEEPLRVIRQIGCGVADDEGRVCALEFEKFWFVDVYTPNAQDGLKRIATRLEWDDASDEERESFTKLLEAGFTDTFRSRHPDLAGAYSWWSYRFNARANNAGWRIDYFLVSDSIADRVTAASIYDEVFGSDHCPVGLSIEL